MCMTTRVSRGEETCRPEGGRRDAKICFNNHLLLSIINDILSVTKKLIEGMIQMVERYKTLIFFIDGTHDILDLTAEEVIEMFKREDVVRLTRL